MKNKNLLKSILSLLVLLIVAFVYFKIEDGLPAHTGSPAIAQQSTAQQAVSQPEGSYAQKPAEPENVTAQDAESAFASIPEYIGMPWCEVNGDVPFFTEDEITDVAFESYGELDSLGRCTPAICCLGFETMPAEGESRGDIHEVHPTGWKQASYDVIDSGNVMTRAHLVAFMLSGENANERNLVTGTRYMNADGMLPFEQETQNYIYNTGNHVMYRVTPHFIGDNLLCSGVLMEALSVEDGGKGLSFCVYIYNVQPGIAFNYANGKSYYNGVFLDTFSSTVRYENAVEPRYIINTKNGKIHVWSCKNVDEIDPSLRQEVTGNILDYIAEGHTPCKGCLGALCDD